jgi:hypothetical protein
MESKEVDNNAVEIKDALTCFICTSQVRDPMMCPQCKRMVCSKCIQKWLDIHEKCPFCQVHTSFNEMIPLPFMNNLANFFIKEIDKKNEEKQKEKEKKEQKKNYKEINNIIEEEDEIDDSVNEKNKINYLSRTHYFPNSFDKSDDDDNGINIPNLNPRSHIIKRGEFCPEHRNELIEYYCLNCNTKHCAKCLLFFNIQSKIHKDHKVITIQQKNKYNIDDIKKNIADLKDAVNELKEYKNNVSIDIKILSKKEEFIKVVIEEFTKYYTNKIEKQNQKLNVTTSSINNQLEAINQIKASCSESLNNFVERDDENGYQEYQKKILGLKDVKKFRYLNNINNIFSKAFLKFYETDYIDIDVDEDNEIIGEKKINVEGLNQELNLKLNSEADDEVLINLLVNLNAFGDENERNEKEKYDCYLLVNNNCNVIGLCLNEKMIHENILILGRTIIKNGLKTIVNEENKIHAKLILSHFNF